MGFFLFGCFSLTSLMGQFSTRTPTINDTLQSIRVSKDYRVAFSIFATKATEVTVRGDFLFLGPTAKLTKSDNGVWSFTSNPIPLDSYTYNFSIDGLMTLNTKSPNLRENPS